MHGFSIEEREGAGKERIECEIRNGECGMKYPREENGQRRGQGKNG